MVFQATKWGWKRIAARLLLVPMLAGGSATIAHAQVRTTPATSATTGRPAAAKPADPQAILKEGRKALEAGRFNEARDLAHRAEASNPTGKWGLFDDTTAALLRDVGTAEAKAKKVEAEHLVKRAKALLAKKPASEGERAANLKAALEMAHRAEALHGSYSAWDFGDRADKLVKEIEAARAKLRLPATQTAAAGAPVMGQQPGTHPPATPPGQTPAAAAAATAGTTPNAINSDTKKVAAVRLMVEGRQLVSRGDFAGAQAKYLEADRLRANFGPKEFSPGFAIQDLKAQGSAAIGRALQEAQAQTARKDYARAEAALAAANEIAAALNLFRKPIDDAKIALRTARTAQPDALAAGPTPAAGPLPAAGLGPVAPLPPGGVAAAPGGPVAPVKPAVGGSVAANVPVAPLPPGGVAAPGGPVAPVKPAVGGSVAANVPVGVPTAPGLSPAGGPETLVPLGPAAPAGAPGVANVAGPVNLTPGQPLTGRQYLDQGALELRKGDFTLASELARQAFNLGLKAEAQELLNSIDAERFNARKRAAMKSFESAAEYARVHDNERAFQVLVRIDPKLLPPEMQAKRDELVAACRAELERTGGPKADPALVAVGGMQPPAAGAIPDDPGGPAGYRRVGQGLPLDPTATAGSDGLAAQADAMRRVTFQKLRVDGLKVQADAQSAFGRGDTEIAIQMLVDYSNRVRAANLDSASTALLLKPVDSRMDMFRVMKGNADAVARLNREKKEAKELLAGRGAADEQRKAEVQRLARQCHELVKQSKFDEAERLAMQAKQLDPDDPAIGAMAHMAMMRRRVQDAKTLHDEKEEMVLKGLNGAEREGPYLDTQDPVSVKVERTRLARLRGRGDDTYLRSRTPKEFEIELKLDQPISVEYHQTPLSEVIDNLRTLTGLPFSYDTYSLEAEAISTSRPITETLPGVSARNALHLILDKAGLNFVIEYDTVRITTNKKAKGRLVTKVFSVADLVTPIPNFAMPEYDNFAKMITKDARSNPNVIMRGLNDGPTPYVPSPTVPRGGMAGGTMAGTLATTPGIAAGMTFGGSGTLQSNPLAASGTLAPDGTSTKHEQLIRLVTGMVRPYSWDALGGPGRIEYFDLGSALVVNQTADVIREIQDLLESLRRLQDLAVAVEVRIISLSESWFERMGVDFSMNISTHNTKFEPNLTSGAFRPEPFLNSLQGYKGVTAGLTAAGAGTNGNTPVFTPDLAVPIQSTSFAQAIPPFGGYPNSPGADGGISLGLAFLNDVQVYLFMEAAQGDRRVNVMQAPKLTLFNGQSATISINELQFFVTGVQVYSVNGQLVFTPTITTLPGSVTNGGSVFITLQAVVSADRRFVRINIPVTLSAQSGTTVPLFPITTFITPVFEGGSQGVPIPFTQFIQQPGFATMTIQTTVVCPDGGTVLLGGFKKLSEGRNEFGPPFLSKIPYLNRLFKNVGIGRDTSHIMIMITPRIIINSEEEINQTEGGPVGSGNVGR